MWERKRSFNWRPFAVIAIVALVLVWAMWPRTPEVVLHAAGTEYELERVIDPQAKLRGLGGRASMPKDKGMVFIYDQSAANRCFWMKDMRFAIDIIWVNSNKEVVRVAHSVAPASYPKDFCAAESSQFVIELNAGEAKRSGIAEGRTLRF